MATPARVGIPALRSLLRHREASVLIMLLAIAVFLAFSNEVFPLVAQSIECRTSGFGCRNRRAWPGAGHYSARHRSFGGVGNWRVRRCCRGRASGHRHPIARSRCGSSDGLVCGIANGLMVTRLKINPFIATLGMLSVARGIALLVTGGIPVTFTGWAEFLGAGRIFQVPVSFILMLILAFAIHVLATRHRLGREIYAIGDNPKAARLAGIDLKKTRLFVFGLCGCLAGLGGVIVAGNLASADPNLGMGYELDVIAAVILGGTALNGGRGSIIGVVIGAMLMALLNNAFVLLGISAYWQVVTKGLVIIIAVGIDGLQRREDDE
jgi:ribose transport system permease protein